MNSHPDNGARAVEETRLWVEKMVIGLNLCPFAKRELVKNRIRFRVSQATREEALIEDLEQELVSLTENRDIETTLLIHPDVLTDFFDYNQFLPWANRLLGQLAMKGLFQIASFHPGYCFAYSEDDAISNFTNRSPYPMLHIIREDSLAEAVANYAEADKIPDRNCELLEAMGDDAVKKLLASCRITG